MQADSPPLFPGSSESRRRCHCPEIAFTFQRETGSPKDTRSPGEEGGDTAVGVSPLEMSPKRIHGSLCGPLLRMHASHRRSLLGCNSIGRDGYQGRGRFTPYPATRQPLRKHTSPGPAAYGTRYELLPWTLLYPTGLISQHALVTVDFRTHTSGCSSLQFQTH